MNHRIKKTWKHRLAKRINGKLKQSIGDTVKVYYSPHVWAENDPASRGQLLWAELSADWQETHTDGVYIDLRKPEPFMEQLANEYHAVAAAYSELAEKIAAVRVTRIED